MVSTWLVGLGTDVASMAGTGKQMSDKRRLVEQALWIDDDYLHLGGYEPKEGEPESWWLGRRLGRQAIWLGLIGTVASDWGRFRAGPRNIAALLSPNVQSDWLEAEIAKALTEFEAIHWIDRRASCRERV